MRILLTSFGIEDKNLLQLASSYTWLRSRAVPRYREMPPVNMRDTHEYFMPDYASLILADQVVMNGSSFEKLKSARGPYQQIAETMLELHLQGFLELADFSSILDSKNTLLKQMLESDMTAFDSWLPPLEESLQIWKRFTSYLYWQLYSDSSSSSDKEMLNFEIGVVETFLDFLSQPTFKYPPEFYDGEMRRLLEHYLAYVNANIVLSNEIGAGFHDWADFTPLYRKKFLSVGKDLEIPRQAEAVNKLFEFSFPEYKISDTKTFMKVVTDRRVQELRELVQEAANGKVIFDEKFARTVFKEVLQTEREITRYRSMVSWLTVPLDFLGFLPGVGALVQKGVEEVSGKVIENKLKQKYQWFYLISDVAPEQESNQMR